jgi:D-beta-D-heptose 7-phosphate kinase/D-beta-D-heptose 1-phosphate adenosyltransferase
LLELLDHLGQPEVLVVGDLMLDRYVWGNAERISQEAPVILLRADQREERLGGASSVATLLRALGANVCLAGVVGDDADGGRIRQMLGDLDVYHGCVLTDASRPSTVKERYMGRAQARHPQQMIRVDYEVRDPLEAGVEARLADAIDSRLRQCDIVLVSDYDKGVCTPGLLQHVVATARRLGRRVLVDPIRCKSAAENQAYARYRGCTAMTPNRLEASLAAGMPIRDSHEALTAGERLQRALDMEACIVTLDKDGMALAHRDGRRAVLPTRPRQVYDITGAGDMVLSVLGMALAAGADYEPAIRLANIAGGLEVEKVGVAPVSRDEIRRDLQEQLCVRRETTPAGPEEKLVDRATLNARLTPLRQAGTRIVFTNGCFDVLHAGHVQYLNEAKAQGDVLVVGINSDQTVRRLKGPARPLNPLAARVEVLRALSAVDYVVPFEEPTPLELIHAVRPDVLVKGADYRKEDVVGAAFVEALGGRVHLAVLKQDFSTTRLLEAMESERRRVA